MTDMRWVSKYDFVPMEQVARIERRSIQPSSIQSGTIYVGLEHIDSSGSFQGVAPIDSGQLASTKFAFTDAHVLYGKLRPYLKKIARPNFSGICSTDILPIRPKRNMNRDFLYHYLRQQYMIDYATAHCSGANLPRLSPNVLRELPIPLPPLPEQKRIAAILDKADAIRRKRQQAIKLADEFLRSVFLDMFGDPVTNPKGWRIEPFGKHVEELRYGSSVKCYAKKFRDSLPVLRIPNIASAKITFDNLAYAALSAKEISNLRLRQGDLLFVRTNGNPEYIGRCAVFQGSSDMLFASYLIRARLRKEGKLLPEYIQAVISMKSFRKVIIKSAKTTAGNYNINTQGLRSLSVPVAPLNYQRKYVELKKKLDRLTAKGNLSDSSGLSLFASLSRRAFRGEL